MSKLLFAAARGARVQFFAAKSHRYEWVDIDRVPLFEVRQGYYRIHPDDEHLQYGPISTALRHAAQHGWFPDTLSGLMAEEAFKYEAGYVFHPGVGRDHLCMLALVMTEALADEGL